MGDNNEEQEYVYNNNNYQANSNNNSNKSLEDFVEEANLAKVKERFDSSSDSEKRQAFRTSIVVAGNAKNNNSNAAQKMEIFQYFLSKDGFNAKTALVRDKPMITALWQAAYSNGPRATQVFDLLLAKGGDINGAPVMVKKRKVPQYVPPIFGAIQGKNRPMLRHILRTTGRDIEIENPQRQGVTPLAYAVEEVWADGVEDLLNDDAKVTFVDIIGDNLLLHVVRDTTVNPDERARILDILTNHRNIKFDFVNPSGKTALMLAVEKGDLNTIRLLLERDSKITSTVLISTEKSRPAIGIAISKIAELLTTLGSLSNGPEKTSLQEEKNKYLAIIKLLLRSGARLEDAVHDGMSLGLLAIQNNDLDLLETTFPWLYPGSPPYEDNDPLVFAVSMGNIQIVEYLLSKGFDINQKDKGGYYALPTAIVSGNIDMVEFLVEHGANLQTDTYSGITSSVFANENTAELIDYFVSKGQDPKARYEENKTPLMKASMAGNAEAIKHLIEVHHVDPTVTLVEGDENSPTAYDMAGNMNARLAIAPYIETDQPRFTGFGRDDFERFDIFFDDPINFVVCPFCFLPLQHTAGCMYLYTHGCEIEKESQRSQGVHRLPLIHTKLFKTYEDDTHCTTVCHYCNRAGYTWPAEGGLFVEHKHIVPNSATPFITPERATRATNAFYFSKEGCSKEGGGGLSEKILRFQVLLNFLCFLNEHFKERISNVRAHLLAREMFWDAALYNGEYLTTIPFSSEYPDIKIKDKHPELESKSVKELLDLVYNSKTPESSNRKFFVLCDPATAPTNLPKEKEIVYPDLPRFGKDAIKHRRTQVGTDTPGGNSCYYWTDVDLNPTGHGDGRALYRFRHRQPPPDRGRHNENNGIYNENAELQEVEGDYPILDHYKVNAAGEGRKELICAECLFTHLSGYLSIQPPEFRCFTGDCQGYFHPSEIQDIVPADFYERYKKLFNQFSPSRTAIPGVPKYGGGMAEEIPLFGAPVVVHQNTCNIRRKGGRRYKTRKPRKTKKTRKARRHSKTHKQ